MSKDAKAQPIKNGVCSECGSATGVVKVKEAVMFQPVKTKHYCTFCKPNRR